MSDRAEALQAAVLEVHQPLEALDFAGGLQRRRQVCTGCGTDSGNWQVYPCPTVRAMERVATEEASEPHAYAVETLWNRGGSRERWGMAMEMSDVSQPLDREDAERLMAEMVEYGHARDAVRLVAVSVVAS